MGFFKTVASYGLFPLLVSQLLLPSTASPFSTNLIGTEYSNVSPRADPKDFYLRIMPLGASITAGDPEAPGDNEFNGYRKALRDQLRFGRWKVNMVGNHNRGSMADSDHEGVPGDRVSQVGSRGKDSAGTWLPNVILINAGTNDATQNGKEESVEGTPGRMKQAIQGLFSKVPDAVVVLSTLIPNEAAQENVDLINNGYRAIVKELVGADPETGEEPKNPQLKVQLADMADGFISKEFIQKDGTHPTIEGFERMASVWAWAIDQANSKGWLTEPSESSRFNDGDGTTTCKKEYGSGDQDPRGSKQVLNAADPVIADDGKYEHSSKLHADLLSDDKSYSEDTQIYFAQLINQGAYAGDELDEIIAVDESAKKVKIRMNKGKGEFGGWTDIDVKDECIVRGIHWGDVNGDGLDDFICISPDGTMYVSLNVGKPSETPEFKYLGKYANAEPGYPQETVRLGDIDGDGRLDYCVFESNGDIRCWRNGGIGDNADYWQDMGDGGPVFKAKGMGDIRGLRFVDINGDGRDDWLWLSKKGEVTTYINQRGEGKGMVPRWLDAGVTHTGMDFEIGDKREYIQFGRIFGGPAARHDYINWEYDPIKFGDLPHDTLKVDVWENTGSGGRFQKGDGAFWGDMTGTGFDDYVWISSKGQVNVFRNKNTKSDFDNYESGPWNPPEKLETGMDRRRLHIGDWNGDGKADVIGVSRKTGSLTVWFSNWDEENSDFGWDRKDIPDSGVCDQGWGVGYFDNGAHFADITGNGRVDYLCMERSGRTTAHLQKDDGSLEDVGQVKFSEELDRANFQFADANGDGKADLIWTDKFNGDGKVWYNEGRKPESERPDLGGSIFRWAPGELVYQGSSRGPNMHFPSLQGQGRADMVEVNPTTAHGWLWFNACPSGGDDVPEGDPLPDPELPEYDPNPIDPPGQDPEHWFCDKNGASWNTSLWEDKGMGSWLVSRTELYSGVDSSWPSDEGVPRVIAEYNVQKHDGSYNWGPECTSASKRCDVTEEHLKNKDVCKKNWERAFSLWAMRNYARFLQTFYAKITDVFDTGSLSTAKIATTFIAGGDESIEMDEAAWYTLASGLVTAGSAFLPGFGQVAGGTFGGLLTAIAGIAGAMGDVEDPRFTTYADLQDNLGKMKLAVQDAIDNYFEPLFRESPPNKNTDKGTELAKLLESGVWAEQDTAELDYDKSDMVRMIHSGIITEVWNAQQVILVRFSSGTLDDIWKQDFDPCFGSPDDKMDEWVACVGDYNYLFFRFPPDFNTSPWGKMGQTEKDLEGFGLSHELVIRTVEKTHSRTGKWIGRRSMDQLEDTLVDMIDDTPDKPADELLQFNIPFCDLDNVKKIEYGQCDTIFECLEDIVTWNSPKLELEGEPFPYDLPSS